MILDYHTETATSETVIKLHLFHSVIIVSSIAEEWHFDVYIIKFFFIFFLCSNYCSKESTISLDFCVDIYDSYVLRYGSSSRYLPVLPYIVKF